MLTLQCILSSKFSLFTYTFECYFFYLIITLDCSKMHMILYLRLGLSKGPNLTGPTPTIMQNLGKIEEVSVTLN